MECTTAVSTGLHPGLRVCDALNYAQNSWPIFPCSRAKTPLTTHGFKDATTDPSQIFDWWGDGKLAPEAIGVPTGTVSGFWVLDIDAPKPGRSNDGRATLEVLERAHEALPATVEQYTGGGGRQLFFAMPTDSPPVKNSASRVGPGLDVRGEGGYVIVPSSLHPTGNYYKWAPDRALWEIALAKAPDWLLALTRGSKSNPSPTLQSFPYHANHQSTPSYGQQALTNELAWLAGAVEGERNDRLNKSAFSLGQLIPGGHLKYDQVQIALLKVAGGLGLPEKEARSTIENGLKSGQKDPRGPSNNFASNKSAQVNPIEYPEPISLNNQQINPLPVEVLPVWAKDFVLAAAEHLQVAPDLVLANVLGVIATACARKMRVEIRQGYQEPLNLYILAPLSSGERKSATQAFCVDPLIKWEAEQAQAMRKEIQIKSSERKSQEAIIQSLRNKLAKAPPDKRLDLRQEIADLEANLPEVPSAPRLLADDVTPEAAALLLAEHGERLGIISAEGGIFDILAGRYSSGIPNLDLFLKAHSGDPYRVDRMNRHGQPIIMQSPALTLCLSPQPEVMGSLAAKSSFRGRGLIARFVFVLSESRLGSRQVSPPPVPEVVLRAYQQAVHTLLDIPWSHNDQGESSAYILKLGNGAWQEWKAFAGYIENELREGGQFELSKDWGGKLPGLAGRLAGLFHAMEHLGKAPKQDISKETMGQVLELVAGLVSHALAAFDMIGNDPDVQAAQHALDWIRQKCVESFSVRDCHRALRGRYHRAAQVKNALTILEERCYILPQVATHEGPGRLPSKHYTVNIKAIGV